MFTEYLSLDTLLIRGLIGGFYFKRTHEILNVSRNTAYHFTCRHSFNVHSFLLFCLFFYYVMHMLF